jgi:hypothetical protein
MKKADSSSKWVCVRLIDSSNDVKARLTENIATHKFSVFAYHDQLFYIDRLDCAAIIAIDG